jgi:hypothetical protein
MTTRRQHLERAIDLIGQAGLEIGHAPAGDPRQVAERDQLIRSLVAIARECGDMLERKP